MFSWLFWDARFSLAGPGSPVRAGVKNPSVSMENNLK
jgi:hypothetical protein